MMLTITDFINYTTEVLQVSPGKTVIREYYTETLSCLELLNDADNHRLYQYTTEVLQVSTGKSVIPEYYTETLSCLELLNDADNHKLHQYKNIEISICSKFSSTMFYSLVLCAEY